MRTGPPRPATEPSLHECPSCGLLQTIPALMPGTTARCVRCPAILRHTMTHTFEHSIALTTAALVLLVIMCTTPLMGVEKAAISRSADLFSGPVELVRQGMSPLAAVVLFVTLVAPFGKLIGTLYVLVRLREARPPRHLRRVFLVAEKLRPWSMIEVFVFGVFVAYVKLSDLVHLQLDPGVFALMALTVVLIWADTALDREAVWDRLGPEEAASDEARRLHRARLAGSAGAGLAGAEPIGCETCGLVSVPHGDNPHCPRCGVTLHVRRPNSVTRTWALVIAAAILYVPANYYPVLTVVQLGAGSPSTILGGIEELVHAEMYPLAALVFAASIAVPMLKLVGLSIMLITTQTGHSGWLRDRTRLYHVVRFIGRWSMIDIFMEALLGALVKFGNVVTIEPGVGALAFCAVVILTMFAAEAFDPRLMWDAATSREQREPVPG